MKRFILNLCRPWAACLSIVLALGVSAFAQPKKIIKPRGPITAKPSDLPVRPMNEYLKMHDLEVEFSGLIENGYYVMSGVIKNKGPGSYPGGRNLELYVSTVTPRNGFSEWLLIRDNIAVPPLQVGATWTTPTFKLETNILPTNRFYLQIPLPSPAKSKDVNPQNDAKLIVVSWQKGDPR